MINVKALVFGTTVLNAAMMGSNITKGLPYPVLVNVLGVVFALIANIVFWNICERSNR